MTITAAEVRRLIDYDPETGQFRWKSRGVPTFDARYAGKIAGTHDTQGYRQIRITGRIYLAHRLAWLVMTDSWPAHEIDHKNRIKDDNRFVNLRPATRQQNCRNSGLSGRSTSGHTGVAWCRKAKKWIAHIGVEGRHIRLGQFAEIEEAIEARRRAEAVYFLDYAAFDALSDPQSDPWSEVAA